MVKFESLKFGGGANDGSFTKFKRLIDLLENSMYVPFITFSALGKTTSKLTDLYAMAMKSKPHERMGIVKATLDLIAWHREVLEGLISGVDPDKQAKATKLCKAKALEFEALAKDILEKIFLYKDDHRGELKAELESLGERMNVSMVVIPALEAFGYRPVHIPALKFARAIVGENSFVGAKVDRDNSLKELEKLVKEEFEKITPALDGSRIVLVTEGFIASASDIRHRYTKSCTATFGYNGSDLSAMIVAEYTHAISKELNGGLEDGDFPFPTVTLMKEVVGDLIPSGTLDDLGGYLHRIGSGLVGRVAIDYAKKNNIAIRIFDTLTGELRLYTPKVMETAQVF